MPPPPTHPPSFSPPALHSKRGSCEKIRSRSTSAFSSLGLCVGLVSGVCALGGGGWVGFGLGWVELDWVGGWEKVPGCGGFPREFQSQD